MARDTQPFKFRLHNADGTTTEGGCESKELCIEHIEYCIRASKGSSVPITHGFYLGKNGAANPREIHA